MGKHSLLITISLASLILIITITSVLSSLGNKINIKDMLFKKNSVNKAATIAEKMVLQKLEEDIKNWEDIIIKADSDEEPSNKEVLYMKYTAQGSEYGYKRAKEILESTSNLKDELEVNDVLIYKVARRLKPVDDKELKEYEDSLVYPLYKTINNIGFNANLWELAEKIVSWALDGLPKNPEDPKKEGSVVIGSRTTDYQQEYPLDDYLKKVNKLNLQGKVSISGDLDASKNTFVANVVQLDNSEIKLYEYSLLDDDFTLIEEATVKAPDWRDATPIITTVYNETNKLIESYIAIYSPSRGILNLYTYSLIEEKIEIIIEDGNLKGLTSNLMGQGEDVIKLGIGEELRIVNIKDVKITSCYNHNMGLPHIMIGVRGQYIYTNSDYELQNDEDIYFYDYFPIVDDGFTLSELASKGEVDNWDTDLTWSNTTQTSLLTVIKHYGDKFEFLSAMPIIDDYFEEIEDLSKLADVWELQTQDGDKTIKNNDIKKLAYASFMDGASNLTKTVLVLNVSGELYQLNGSMELEEWDEVYKIKENKDDGDYSVGDLELTAIKGDISSIHLIEKPIVKNFFIEEDVEIEIPVFDQRNDTRTIVRNKYYFKIYSDFDIDYETIEKKRDMRGWNDADIGHIEE